MKHLGIGGRGSQQFGTTLDGLCFFFYSVWSSIGKQESRRRRSKSQTLVALFGFESCKNKQDRAGILVERAAALNLMAFLFSLRKAALYKYYL